MKRVLVIGIVWSAFGCRSAGTCSMLPPAAPAPPVAAASPAPQEMPDSLHWFRNSAEYRALALQSYRIAGSELAKAAAARKAGDRPWAVILDADETVLDNSGYEKELLDQGVKHTPAHWSDWVGRKQEPLVPGALAFVQGVRSLGGRIAIVSNRTTAECPDTAATFVERGVPYDVLLCKSTDQKDKLSRFDEVASGAAFKDKQAVDVLMWVGDNILDFPGLSQAARKEPEGAFEAFGARFVILPNPVYGSWESNPKE
jgi:5'-nucleotidase (lipoprotein e(P4) family)